MEGGGGEGTAAPSPFDDVEADGSYSVYKSACRCRAPTDACGVCEMCDGGDMSYGPLLCRK